MHQLTISLYMCIYCFVPCLSPPFYTLLPHFSACSSSPLHLFPSLLPPTLTPPFPSPPSSPSSLLPSSPQGLYEYAKPAWQEQPCPQVDEGKVKNFGQNVAPRPLNPAEKQIQLYPVAMEINRVEDSRYGVYMYIPSLCTSSSRLLHSSCTVFLHPLLSFLHFSYPLSSLLLLLFLPLSIDRTLKMGC